MLLVWLKEKRRRDSHVDVNIRETHHGAEIWSCFIIWTGSPQLTHSTADWVLEQSFSLCGGFWYHIFGSGTRLYVSGKSVKKPEVTVCSVKTEPTMEGKTALMCLASDMFPPLVQISWKRQEKNNKQEQLPPAEEKQVEFSGSERSAMVRLVNDDTLYNYEYICEVIHEGGKVRNQTLTQEFPDPTIASPPGAVPPRSGPPAGSVPPQLPVKLSVSFQSQCRVKLLCLLYTVLIVKSLVYCCGLSLLMMLRTKGPSTI
ncbi:uncharacterized protein LOC124870152 [Girardinichthys multiradiatus]|uniref:uncharacterized protein LOC124870152 n=1 Tax=Girardinichthys multiradiatus TaxID=208333 RepID=UPI001FAC1039|nr:uncharacterized protein LOC124870152 [Girardinichthys multiradiatus]